MYKKTSRCCSFGRTQVLCLRRRSANRVHPTKRDLLLITARTDIYLNRGDVAPVLWRALCGRVQDRWVLAAVRKLRPQFKCTKIPTIGIVVVFRQNCLLLLVSCHVAPMTVFLAVEQRC